MAILDSPLLLADIREVIGSLVGLVLLVLWVIGQLAEGKKQANRQAAQRAAEPPRPAAPPVPQRPVAAQGAAKPQAAGGLRGEMEEFLRRAAAQKGGGQARAGNRPAMAGKPQPAAGDKIEVLVDEHGRIVAEGRRMGDRMHPKEQRPPGAPRPAPEAGGSASGSRRRARLKRESVADHVSQHVAASTRAISEQASTLGQRIVQEDAQFDVQLKAKFDHEVGKLASEIRVTDTPSQSPDHRDSTSPAGQLAALLASPDGVRQAIILNEILRRPSERW